MPPALAARRSYQTVLPIGVPLHVVLSGPAPPSGWPCALGLKRSACVVASVVSSTSLNGLEAIVVDARELSLSGGAAAASEGAAAKAAAVSTTAEQRRMGRMWSLTRTHSRPQGKRRSAPH